MKNKHPNAIVVLALGFAMAGLHLADLLLWSDAETGFATAGLVWLRYIPWLAALVLPYLPARRAANQPTGLQDTCPPLGLCMVLAGAALVTSGVAMGPVAKYAVQYPEMFSTGYPTWAAWADLLLPVLCGAWLLYYGGRAFKVLSGDRVEIRQSQQVTRLVKLTGRNFYELIHQKLGKD